MRKITLALVLAFTSLAGLSHAARGPASSAKPSAAPTVAALKKYLAAARLQPVPATSSKSPLAFKLAMARHTHPRNFRALTLTKPGVNLPRIAYIPKVAIKGLAANTAYIVQDSGQGMQLVGTVKLSLR